MNLPVPPKSTYKAFLWDYDSLLAYSDEECCYSLSEREIQLLLAQIDPIAWKTRYKPTETEIDLDTIQKWQGNLARKLMTGCCPDDGTLGRYGENGEWEVSTDGGETWTPTPEEDPRNDYIGAPPLTGEPSDAKRCAAADNIRARFLEQRDYIISLLDASPTLISIISGILAFIAFVTGIGGATIGISVLILGMASALIAMTPEEVEAQIDDEALDTFKCLVYCRLNADGELTYAEWVALLADIAAEFSDFPETFFYNTVNAFGQIGMTNAGTIGVTTAEDCEDCDCPGGCASKYQIWTQSAGDWGVIVASGDDWFDVEIASSGFALVEAIDGEDCCEGLSVELISGTGTQSAYLDCGTVWTGGAFNAATIVGHCINAIEYQGTAGSIIRTTLTPCA